MFWKKHGYDSGSVEVVTGPVGQMVERLSPRAPAFDLEAAIMTPTPSGILWMGENHDELWFDDAAGDQRWRVRFADIGCKEAEGVSSTPVVSDRHVVFPVDAGLACLDAGTGKLIWRVENTDGGDLLEGFQPYPSFNQGEDFAAVVSINEGSNTVHVTSEIGIIRSLDLATGAILGWFPIMNQPETCGDLYCYFGYDFPGGWSPSDRSWAKHADRTHVRRGLIKPSDPERRVKVCAQADFKHVWSSDEQDMKAGAYRSLRFRCNDRWLVTSILAKDKRHYLGAYAINRSDGSVARLEFPDQQTFNYRMALSGDVLYVSTVQGQVLASPCRGGPVEVLHDYSDSLVREDHYGEERAVAAPILSTGSGCLFVAPDGVVHRHEPSDGWNELGRVDFDGQADPIIDAIADGMTGQIVLKSPTRYAIIEVV